MNNFSASDICVLTPTKDRPHKIVNLLDSLVAQTKKVGRVIVVGSGQNIGEIVRSYDKKFKIEYYHSDIAGQICQRKLGVSKLDSRTRLVATLDDDIVLDSDAIEQLISFWNHKGEETVGVGFNITNFPSHKYSRVKELFFASAKEPGKVLKSGFVTQLVNVSSDIRTEWLNGGATSWKQDIIVNNIHAESINSKWAPCEDLILSYPIGKIYELYVCVNARVLHDDLVETNIPFSLGKYRGEMLVYWILYFAEKNQFPSIKAFIALTTTSFLDLLLGVFRFNIGRIGSAMGKWKGIFNTLILRKISLDLIN